MTRHRKSYRVRRRSKPGAAPGTLLALSDASATRIDVIAYGPDAYLEETNLKAASVPELRGKYPVLWINITGLRDVETIQTVGEEFGLHSLALEDVMNVHQRAKFEDFEGHLFLIARMVQENGPVDTEQVAMFLGEDFLLTFQEREGDNFDPIRKRLREAKGRIRQSPSDYLCYTLIDAIVDSYFPVLERLGNILDELESRVITEPHNSVVAELHEFKRDMLVLRHPIWQHREMINAIIRDGDIFFSSTTRVYVRDIYDHIIQEMDMVEIYRETASGLIDVYISSVSAKLNEIMKVLAIIATIFMPLTFIAGVYGMNFQPAVSPWNMPELQWYFGYPFTLLLMIASTAGLLWYFAKKRWITTFRRGAK